jgi:hypothetical protein
LSTDLEPWVELVPCSAVHPDLASPAAFPAADEDSAAGAVQIALLELQRFADPQARAPQQRDQRPQPVTLWTITDDPHERDDLLDRWGVSLAVPQSDSMNGGVLQGEKHLAVNGLVDL